MFYATTLIEYKMLMFWQPIIEYFGPNIQHIYGVDKKVADMISRLPYISVNKYNHSTIKYQCCLNELFTISRE